MIKSLTCSYFYFTKMIKEGTYKWWENKKINIFMRLTTLFNIKGKNVTA